MKKTLLTILLLSTTSKTMAQENGYDGYSAMKYATVAGAYGTEIASSGGFCSVSGGAGCENQTSGMVGRKPLGTALETGTGAGINGITGDMAQITVGSADAPNLGTYTTIQSIANGGYVNPSNEFVINYDRNGGMTVTQKNQSGSNPITLGVVNSAVYAAQATNGDTASGTRSDSVAISGQGTSESYAQVLVRGQAVAP